ncbi:hypothetical protein F4775DRAFT_591281 [Biscogniauxia sp. FL1348]|nr:hypothetical protein F4775DRAFT_591281 [Biscogniauxia sp. FL1348]
MTTSSTLLALLLLSGSSSSSGAALTADADADACTGNQADAGYCTTLTYVDRTDATAGAPTTSDCQATCRGVLQDPGDWIVQFAGVPAGGRHQMLGYACGFSVGRGDGEPADLSFSMANQDILDILDEVTRRFGGAHGGGAVAAEGTMECQGHVAKWYVD